VCAPDPRRGPGPPRFAVSGGLVTPYDARYGSVFVVITATTER
jgi:hypothetical protein